MSLDVGLVQGEPREVPCERCKNCPDCDGTGKSAETDVVFDQNITHNLNKMAMEAGIYQHLWRPERLGITKAKELIEPLTTGLALMKGDRPRFEAFNAPNGWGTYEHFIPRSPEGTKEALRLFEGALPMVIPSRKLVVS